MGIEGGGMAWSVRRVWSVRVQPKWAGLWSRAGVETACEFNT